MDSKIIDFYAEKCTHCYKCIHHCDVKAVRVHDGHAIIIPENCILCGHCLKICPHSAKRLHSDLDYVQALIKNGYRVVASIAPSYMGLLEYQSLGQVRAALMKLGFEDVRETAEGAAYVTEAYTQLLEAHQMDNIITTSCPSVNDLIEIYYPQLIPSLAPVVSPMIAHGRLLKNELGSDVKVVFIGPCISKKKESLDSRHQDAIDAVLHFEDIRNWLNQKQIVISECEDLPFQSFDIGVNRLYPVTNGIVNAVTVTEKAPDSYRKFYVHGTASCIELCKNLVRGDIHGCFIEMNLCSGGCINGSAENDSSISRFKVKLDIEEKIERRAADLPREIPEDTVSEAASSTASAHTPIPFSQLELSKNFIDRSLNEPVPSEAQIRKILAQTNKFHPEDERNCGACGYPTCRDKAIAVFQKKAELDMCIPYLLERTKSMAHLVLETSPNIILITDTQMRILEYSGSSEHYFGVKHSDAMQMYLDEIINPDDFRWVADTHQNIHGKKVFYPEYHLATLQNIVYIEKVDAVMGIFIDTTHQEEQSRIEYEKKLETIDLAQRIISKQMMVVQEIAGLLGETTAETQITLSKLCQSLLDDSDPMMTVKTDDSLKNVHLGSGAVPKKGVVTPRPGYVHVGKTGDLKQSILGKDPKHLAKPQSPSYGTRRPDSPYRSDK